jgi:signal transduction histidine kinase
MVRDSSNHLLRLINDVLDISKIEAGQLEIMREPVDLPKTIHKATLATLPLAHKKHLTIDVVVAPDVGTIVSDQRRVEQVLLNLLANAVKFTEVGGVRVEARRETAQAIIRVADTGIGIRNEDLTSLFRPFSQVDAGITRRYEGTGLGLHICRRLVDLLGGTIGVESAWGKGSVFSVALPCEERAP